MLLFSQILSQPGASPRKIRCLNRTKGQNLREMIETQAEQGERVRNIPDQGLIGMNPVTEGQGTNHDHQKDLGRSLGQVHPERGQGHLDRGQGHPNSGQSHPDRGQDLLGGDQGHLDLDQGHQDSCQECLEKDQNLLDGCLGHQDLGQGHLAIGLRCLLKGQRNISDQRNLVLHPTVTENFLLKFYAVKNGIHVIYQSMHKLF